jgi:hypothetical protein
MDQTPRIQRKMAVTSGWLIGNNVEEAVVAFSSYYPSIYTLLQNKESQRDSERQYI